MKDISFVSCKEERIHKGSTQFPAIQRRKVLVWGREEFKHQGILNYFNHQKDPEAFFSSFGNNQVPPQRSEDHMGRVLKQGNS